METLYEQDYELWAEQIANLLAAGRFDELNIKNLVEEVCDLSKRERDRLLSSLRLIVHHLLKWDYQPQKRSRSWQIIVELARFNIKDHLRDSHSLKRYLTDKYVNQVYEIGRLDVIAETDLDMPVDCGYSIADVWEGDVNLT